MNPRLLQKLIFSFTLIGYSFLGTTPAYACAVCFGDPDSPMSKGALMGVIVMLGIIGSVLMGIAGTTMFWMHRANRLTFQQKNPPSASL